MKFASTMSTEATEASLLSLQATLIMLRLKTESKKDPPDGFIPFLNEAPRVTRMELVDVKNEKGNKEVKVHSSMSDTEHRKTCAASCLECHKRSMRSINQDPSRPILTRHFIAEIDVQLKVHQKKGTVIDVFYAVSRIVFEVLQHENYAAKTADRISRLAYRGHWMKDFLEKKIMA